MPGDDGPNLPSDLPGTISVMRLVLTLDHKRHLASLDPGVPLNTTFVGRIEFSLRIETASRLRPAVKRHSNAAPT